MFPVAVLAGGLGTRLREVTGDTLPKVLVPVLGRPFLDWKLEGLAAAGVTHVVLLVGHAAEQIRAHIGNGSQFGLEVTYVDDGPGLRGTGGALRNALPARSDAFWVTYGDTLLEVDLADAEARFDRAGTDALMTVLHNHDEWEPSNVRVDGDLVAAYAKDPRPAGAEHIDYGMLAFRRAPWLGWSEEEHFDLGAVLNRMIQDRRVTAYEVTERFRDIGTVDALRETERHLAARAGP